MNHILEQSNHIQKFEWVILLMALGIIVFAVHSSIENRQPEEVPGQLLQSVLPAELAPDENGPDQKLAEQALFAELYLACTGSRVAENWIADTNWSSFGIPSDEQEFFAQWRSLHAHSSMTADEWLEKLQEAHHMYEEIGGILSQSPREDTLFDRFGRFFNLPAETFRQHLLENQPATPGQWAIFVAQQGY